MLLNECSSRARAISLVPLFSREISDENEGQTFIFEVQNLKIVCELVDRPIRIKKRPGWRSVQFRVSSSLSRSRANFEMSDASQRDDHDQ